ncbi:MAG: hypothetical protein MZV65_30830 [Chromatiales bacterium]|nr:hypothetical protein [Chromatiales bacterium]
MPPSAFIPAAERYNLMPALDRWVVEHAFAWLATPANAASCPATELCCINLSGQSLSATSSSPHS